MYNFIDTNRAVKIIFIPGGEETEKNVRECERRSLLNNDTASRMSFLRQNIVRFRVWPFGVLICVRLIYLRSHQNRTVYTIIAYDIISVEKNILFKSLKKRCNARKNLNDVFGGMRVEKFEPVSRQKVNIIVAKKRWLFLYHREVIFKVRIAPTSTSKYYNINNVKNTKIV